ncbi:glycerol-3-phosphate 1-O-acyltransferase PlsY [Paraferrimonas sp. SM1919]|uniref:glycerol-3-phosphate 1-O-acyltransferase PlsY n=1 Tax=Paraferrimonas sp. SM1919 TaxID=2662263 RepID=UPI0013D513A8|nr:glycerol-3-phosphate 1-O-acyltransferase PlsY [Paraferrimonas sp. SM1919]
MLPLIIIMILVAYLLGSISSAILVCKVVGLPDPRTQGSKNPGATNVLRMGGKGSAILVLVFDVLKGTIPVYGSFLMGIDSIWLGVIAIAACLGHIYPCFFNYEGGKGVATAFGAIAPIGEHIAFAMVITWIVVLIYSRYSSLAAIISASFLPFFMWLFDDRFVVPSMMLAGLIIWRHRENIGRLIDGTESPFNAKK